MTSAHIALDIPTAVIYDTHMTTEETQDFIRKTIAVEYYLKHNVSIGYCAHIACMHEEDFMRYLGTKGISVFNFDSEKEFLEELANA